MYVLILIVFLFIVLADLFNISGYFPFLRTLDFKNLASYNGAVITGLITLLAMKLIDDENKKRWEKDYYTKQKSEYIFKLIISLGDSLNYYDEFLKEITEIKDIYKVFKKEKSDIFLKCANNSSTLSIFWNKKDDLFKKELMQIKKESAILANIIYYASQIISLPNDALSELEGKKIISIDRDEEKLVKDVFVNIISFIEFFLDRDNTKKYREQYDFGVHFYTNFETEYDSDFEKLITSYKENADIVYTILQNKTEVF